MDSDEFVGLGRVSGSGKDLYPAGQYLFRRFCFILYHRTTSGIAAESNNKQFLLEES